MKPSHKLLFNNPDSIRPPISFLWFILNIPFIQHQNSKESFNWHEQNWKFVIDKRFSHISTRFLSSPRWIALVSLNTWKLLPMESPLMLTEKISFQHLFWETKMNMWFLHSSLVTDYQLKNRKSNLIWWFKNKPNIKKHNLQWLDHNKDFESSRGTFICRDLPKDTWSFPNSHFQTFKRSQNC